MKTYTLHEFLATISPQSARHYSQLALPVPCELCLSTNLTILRQVSAVNSSETVEYPSAICRNCGYVQQLLRLPPSFYTEYYSSQYSLQQSQSSNCTSISINSTTGEKSEDSILNGELRASYFERFLNNAFGFQVQSTCLQYLDVGCGSGGFLSHFQKYGWHVYGNDPDLSAVKCAQRYRSICVDFCNAEEMSYDTKFDIITIVGSLEHCRDPHEVLQKCKSLLSDNGLLAVSGRFNPVGYSHQYLNFNHHRYLRKNQLQLLLKYNGFDTILATSYPVLGENTGRDGEGWCFAKHETWKLCTNIAEYAKLANLYESPENLASLLHEHDASLDP